MGFERWNDAMRAVLTERYDELKKQFGTPDTKIARDSGLSVPTITRYFGKRHDRDGYPDLRVSELENLATALSIPVARANELAAKRMH